MKSNKKFLGRAILLCILGVLFMFVFSGLQSDQVNIIQTFVTEWTAASIQLPITVGNFVTIALTFVYGTLFLKYGVKKPLIIVLIITAIGCVLTAVANGLDCNGGAASGNYTIFFIALFITRCGCAILQLAGFQLVANWFIKYRGQMMGIITIGSPLFSVIGTSMCTKLIQSKLGGDYRPFFVGLAILIIVICIVVALGISDTPEQLGLYPDGADHPPKSEADEEVQLKVGDILRSKKGWQLIIAFGAFYFTISACMGSMTVYYGSLSLDPTGPMGGMDVWIQATTYLAIGCVLGIPMSYLFGILDDKLGSVKASIVLGLTVLIPPIALLAQPMGGNTKLMLLWGFGVACMTGGIPTLHPCITAFAYGRKEYQSANRIIMTIQLIPFSFAAMIMTLLIQSGKGKLAYSILIVVIIIGIIATASMMKMKDANAADRMYGNNEKYINGTADK